MLDVGCNGRRMMSSERLNYYNYFTEIEEHFVRRRGKHLLISPMDWGLIAAWRDAGIPLQVALRGIDIAMDAFFSRQRRESSKINSLCYCHDSVMAEYDAYKESRVGESGKRSEAGEGDGESAVSTDNKEEVKESLDYIALIAQEIKDLIGKEDFSPAALEGLQRVLDRLEGLIPPCESLGYVDLETLERDLVMTDSLLVETLRSTLPEERTAEWEKEAKSELKVYRKKLPKEMYLKIQDNFIRNKVHHQFNIREFSLFRL